MSMHLLFLLLLPLLLRYQGLRHTPQMHHSLEAYCATLVPPPWFRRSCFCRQAPPHAYTMRETPSSERRNSMGENCPVILPKYWLPCILDKQIKARPTRCNEWWFNGNQLFLKQHPFHSAHISLPDSLEPQQLRPGQNTTGSDTHSALLTTGVKTPETCWGTTDCQ